MIYIGTDEGIYRWISGSAWPAFHSLQEQAILSLCAGGEGVLAALDSRGRVWESTSNGMEWRELSRPGDIGRPTALGVVREGRGNLVLASAGPLALHSRRIGVVSPEELPEPAPLTRVLQRVGLGGGTATLERAKRARQAEGWRALGVPETSLAGRLNGVRSLSVGEAWFAAIVADGLWRSDDAGATWTRCEGPPAEVALVRQAGDVVAAATSAGLWISGDRGQTWAERSEGFGEARCASAVEIKPDNPKVLLAGAGVPRDGGQTERNALYESKDGGQTWKQVTRGFPVDLEADRIVDIRYDPAATDFAAVAMASGELWRTHTDGFWWEPLARQIQRARVLCPAAQVQQ